MASGMAISQECIDRYQEMKQNHTLSYLILKIDKNEIVVDQEGEAGAPFEQCRDILVEVAKKKEARYCFFDFPHELTTEQASKNKTGKIGLILWSCDDIVIKQKMTYTSSLDVVKKACTGFTKAFEIHDIDELQEEEFRKECGLNKKV